MPRARMTANRDGSPDGIRIERYAAGQVYDLPAALFAAFAGAGDAEAADEPPEPSPSADKQAEQDLGTPAVPQRKAERPAPKRRGRPRKSTPPGS